MPEPQALVAPPSVFKGFAKSQYEAGAQMMSPEEGEISSWPEAVQYFLRNYAQTSRISFAIADLRALCQEAMETERELAAKLNQSIGCCSNIQPPEEDLTFYIIALHPKIRTVVARYREFHRRAAYLNLADYAQHERNAVRARTSTYHAGCLTKLL